MFGQVQWVLGSNAFICQRQGHDISDHSVSNWVAKSQSADAVQAERDARHADPPITEDATAGGEPRGGRVHHQGWHHRAHQGLGDCGEYHHLRKGALDG